MKTIKLNIYKITELEDSARETAIENYRQNGYYGWENDNENSLRKFEDIFPIRIKNFEYGNRNYIDFTFTENEEIEELHGFRLAKYLWNNYKNDIWKGKYYSSRMISTGRKTPPMYNYKYIHSKVTREEGYNMTGFHMDYPLLNPIYEFCKAPDDRNFYDLMKECLENWISDCNKDLEYTQTDEYITEHMEANEYEFLENGKVYR